MPHLDYLRIYVPKDSRLISSYGFDTIAPELFANFETINYAADPDLAIIEHKKEIDGQSKTEIFMENDKTVFANWLKTEPGQTKKITINYQLPFKLDLNKTAKQSDLLDQIIKNLNDEYESNTERYSLLWQKQSGRHNFDINVNIKFPDNFNYHLTYPDELSQQNKQFTYKTKLNTDQLIGLVFSR